MNGLLSLIYALISACISIAWLALVFVFELLIAPVTGYLVSLAFAFLFDRAATWLLDREARWASAILLGLQVLLPLLLILIWLQCAAFLAISAIADLQDGWLFWVYVVICASVSWEFAHQVAAISISRAEKNPGTLTAVDTYMTYLSIGLGIFSAASTVVFAAWPSVIPSQLQHLPLIWYGT